MTTGRTPLAAVEGDSFNSVLTASFDSVGADGAEMGTTEMPLEEDIEVGTDEIGEIAEEPTATPEVKVETESCVTTRLTPSVA